MRARLVSTAPPEPSTEGVPGPLRRHLPFLQWLPGYQQRWLRADVLAGLTVTALLIPEGMAYAQLAGVSPEAAFYAAPAALLVYALLGTSRQLVVAVSSAVAITSAATVSELAVQGTGEYVALTAALALLAGAVSVLAGLAHLGRIVQFFSSSVLLGFVFGLALIISMKQIPKILGIDVSEPDFFAGLRATVVHLDETSVATLAVGASCIVAMVALERLLPKLPAALMVLVGSIVVSALLDLSARGVAVVGALPSGLAAPSIPDVELRDLSLLLAGAFGIALLAFAEATGPAQQFAREHDTEVDANQELLAIGGANAAAGLFHGFPIGASLSKSAANDRAGAHTPVSLLVAAVATALVALFFTPLFAVLPEAALAAIVLVAVSDMERIGPLRRLWRLRRADCVLALVALTSVLLLDILPGLAVAVVASLGLVVWRSGEARLRHSSRPSTGLVVARPQQMLFFVNANEVRDAVLDAVEQSPGLRVLLLDLGLSPDLDVPATDAIHDLVERVHRRRAEVWLVASTEQAAERLRTAGLVEAVGADHLFDDLAAALLTYLTLTGPDDIRTQVLHDALRVVRDGRDHPRLGRDGELALQAVEQQLIRHLLPLPPEQSTPEATRATTSPRERTDVDD